MPSRELDLKALKKMEQVRNQKKKQKSIILGCVGILAFLLLWVSAVKFEWVNPRLIVYPTEVIKTLIDKITNTAPDGALLHEHILASLEVALSGFICAVVVGVPLGLLMGWFRLFDRFMRPLFEIIRPIPPISWIPIIILLLGIGLKAKMVIIFFAAFIPSLINSYTGNRLTNQVYINVAKTCGASNWRTFFRVGIPSALPMVFAGIRISLGSSWSTLIAAEMLAATAGVGFLIMMGRTYTRIDIIIAGMVVIAIIGLLLSMILTAVERSVIKWHDRRK